MGNTMNVSQQADARMQTIDKTLIKIENIKKYFPIKKGLIKKTIGYVRAVDDVSFEIDEGKIFGLVGESGCGKSTLGSTIIGLEKPTAGRVYFAGRDVNEFSYAEKKKLRTNMQKIFQNPYSSLDPRKNILEILSEPLRVYNKVPRNQVEQKVDSLMNSVGLPKGYKYRFPSRLSGGERQRVSIARALTLEPKMIVCDEPVASLDVSIQAQILNLLKDLQDELNLTYLFIAHGLGAVQYICNKVAVMYLGTIMEMGMTDEIFNHPLHPYTKALLDAYPVSNPHRRGDERIILQGDVPSPVHKIIGCKFQARCAYTTDKCKMFAPKLVQSSARKAMHLCACFL